MTRSRTSGSARSVGPSGAPALRTLAVIVLTMLAGYSLALPAIAQGPVLPVTSPENSEATEPPVMLVADELEYDQENQLIIARGNVEIVQGVNWSSPGQRKARNGTRNGRPSRLY